VPSTEGVEQALARDGRSKPDERMVITNPAAQVVAD
jgi:hypothetical protein